MARRRKRRVWAAVRLALVCYVGVLLLLLALENALLYHPVRASEDWVNPASVSLSVEDVNLTSTDGTRIHGWWCPLPGGAPATEAALFCHGNAGNLSHRAYLIADWHRHLQMPVFIFDYPGYGKSDGKPSERGCYAAADAAFDWLVRDKGISAEQVLLCGESLGGAVAIDLACRRPHRGVVLISTFTSVPDVAQRIYPWLPVRWLMRNRFDNLAKVGQCRKPLFVVHGLADSLVPYAHSETLCRAANDPKKLLLIPGHEHNSVLPADFYTTLKQFLAATEVVGAAQSDGRGN